MSFVHFIGGPLDGVVRPQDHVWGVAQRLTYPVRDDKGRIDHEYELDHKPFEDGSLVYRHVGSERPEKT